MDTVNRAETLDAAREIVCAGRQEEYGGPSFSVIAGFWSVYLGRTIMQHDVAAMMALLKLARIRSNPTHHDSWIDLAGYSACGNEVAR